MVTASVHCSSLSGGKSLRCVAESFSQLNLEYDLEHKKRGKGEKKFNRTM